MHRWQVRRLSDANAQAAREEQAALMVTKMYRAKMARRRFRALREVSQGRQEWAAATQLQRSCSPPHALPPSKPPLSARSFIRRRSVRAASVAPEGMPPLQQRRSSMRLALPHPQRRRVSLGAKTRSFVKRRKVLRQRDGDMAGMYGVIKEARLRAELDAEVARLGWRGTREYAARQALAWAINILVLLLTLFTCLIYALKFGEIATYQMVMSWMISYAWTFLIVEPVQVVILACAPCLFNEEHTCGRCMGRIRFVYNELLSP